MCGPVVGLGLEPRAPDWQPGALSSSPFCSLWRTGRREEGVQTRWAGGVQLKPGDERNRPRGATGYSDSYCPGVRKDRAVTGTALPTNQNHSAPPAGPWCPFRGPSPLPPRGSVRRPASDQVPALPKWHRRVYGNVLPRPFTTRHSHRVSTGPSRAAGAQHWGRSGDGGWRWGWGGGGGALAAVRSLILGAPPLPSVSSMEMSAKLLLLLSLEIFPDKYLSRRNCFGAGPDITAE